MCTVISWSISKLVRNKSVCVCAHHHRQCWMMNCPLKNCPMSGVVISFSSVWRMSSWVSSYTPDSGQVIAYLKSLPIQSAWAYVLIEFLALQRQRPYIVAKCSVFIPTVSLSFLQSFNKIFCMSRAACYYVN